MPTSPCGDTHRPDGPDGPDFPEWDSPGVERVRRVRGGPVLVRGPVRITSPDGRIVTSDRFVVAVCMCRRSGIYPLCDTSHRRRHP